MLFNSIGFAIFLPLVFALYWGAFGKNLARQNLFLVVVSFIFYACWDWRFLFLILFSSTTDFFTAFYLDKTEDSRKRKILLSITLATNLTLLGFFKYYNFLVNSLIGAFSFAHLPLPVHTLDILLPVGISFYTFQSIAYVIDVYNGRVKACTNYITFMAFISFFPQLIAGPISRAGRLLVQFYEPRKFDYVLAVSGLRFILIGIFKKVVIADNLARLVDEVYRSPSEYAGITSATAMVFFAFQIYFDFSGYSDIALGTARLLGFDLIKNFNIPFASKNITEFWRRWHISLSTWLNDYIYTPYALKRREWGKMAVVTGLLLTFAVSGLWHGAAWTFIVFGLLHGVALIYEYLTRKRRRKMAKKIPPFIYNSASLAFTFLFLLLAWVFFRAKTMDVAFTVIRSLAHGWNMNSLTTLVMKVYFSPLFFTCLVVVSIFFLFIESRLTTDEGFLQEYPRLVRWPVYYFLILLIIFMGLQDNAPNFIYFQF